MSARCPPGVPVGHLSNNERNERAVDTGIGNSKASTVIVG